MISEIVEMIFSDVDSQVGNEGFSVWQNRFNSTSFLILKGNNCLTPMSKAEVKRVKNQCFVLARHYLSLSSECVT